MSKIYDMKNKQFGYWTIIDRAENTGDGKAQWLCRCICGKEKIMLGYYLRHGDSKSCGCKTEEMRIQTYYERTGYKKPAQNPEVMEKMTKTYYERTGYKKPAQNPEVMEKMTKTYKDKTGYDCAFQNPEVQKNLEELYLKKYNCKNPSQNPEVKEKKKHTTFQHYGVENPSQSLEIQNKKAQTSKEHFGVDHPMKSEIVKNQLKKTCKNIYGHESPMQNPEIALKSAKHCNNSYILKHWKTNEDIVCVASYEKKTVEYLNNNKINYEWQKHVFYLPPDNMGKIKTFRPDCYLPDQDLWIEIKGYMRKDAKEKWEWFHKEHINSELWDKAKLKELKILS